MCVRCVSLHWIAFSTRDRRSIYKLCYGATPAEIRERMYVRMNVRVSVGIFSFFFNSIEKKFNDVMRIFYPHPTIEPFQETLNARF